MKLNRTDNIIKAEQAMGFKADSYVNLLDEPQTPPHKEGARQYQRHVAIEWEGGVLWLNMFDFVNNFEDDEHGNQHFCIDVRQFNSAGKLKGEGVFTMARNAPRGMIVSETTDDDWKLPQGHKHTGGFVVAILTDPDGKEMHIAGEREG